MELADYVKMLRENIQKDGEIPNKITIFLNSDGQVVSATIEYS